jgi:hypothetical protein
LLRIVGIRASGARDVGTWDSGARDVGARSSRHLTDDHPLTAREGVGVLRGGTCFIVVDFGRWLSKRHRDAVRGALTALGPDPRGAPVGLDYGRDNSQAEARVGRADAAIAVEGVPALFLGEAPAAVRHFQHCRGPLVGRLAPLGPVDETRPRVGIGFRRRQRGPDLSATRGRDAYVDGGALGRLGQRVSHHDADGLAQPVLVAGRRQATLVVGDDLTGVQVDGAVGIG